MASLSFPASWLTVLCLLTVLNDANGLLVTRSLSLLKNVDAFSISMGVNTARYNRFSLVGKMNRKHDDCSFAPLHAIEGNMFDYTKEQNIGTTIYSGEPTPRAKQINARQLITKANIYTVYGIPINVNDIIEGNGNQQKPTTSIVVFLRSLG